MKKNRDDLYGFNCRIKKMLFVMKLTIAAFFLGLMSLSAASTYSQNTKITLDLEHATLVDVFKQIEAQSEFVFIFKNEVINLNKNVVVKIEGATVDKVLDQILKDFGVKYEIIDKQIIITPDHSISPKTDVIKLSETAPQPQKKEISGTVKDSKGFPLPGTTVAIKGTTIGTITDTNGHFTLSIPADTKVLVFSFIGMKSQEVAFTSKTTLNILMQEESVQLNEVVALGYDISMTREKLTGSIASVKGESLMDRTTTSPLMLLDGLATGVRVSTTTSLPGVLPVIQVRQVSSWNAGSGVLYVIDGVVRDVYAFQALNPDDIASVSVLKDAASAAIYGMKAGNGVLLVTTKTGVSGKTKIEYDYSYSLSTPYILFHQLNAYDYAVQENKWNTLVGRASNDSRWFQPYELEYFKTHSYNALSDFWSNPQLQNHNISASGGNEKVKYFVSGSYTNSSQPSFSVGYEKYTMRAKIDAKLTNRLSFNLNITAEWDKNVRPSFGSSDFQSDWGAVGNSGGTFSQLLMRDPTRPYFQVINGVKYPLDAIVAQLVLGQGGTQTYNNTFINPIATLKYTIPGIEGLVASVQFAYNSQSSKNKLWSVSPYTYNFIMDRHIVTNNFNYAGASGWRSQALYTNQTTASLSQTYGSDNGYQGNYQFTYKHSFGLHNVSALGGYEFRGRQADNISATRYGYALNTYNQINGGSTNLLNQLTAGDITTNEGMASWVGRFDYDFNSRYFLGCTIRRDGSYKFAQGGRWGNFPAVSAAWILSKEPFFSPLTSILSFFKIRASWGVTGTDNTNPFQWQNTFAVGSPYVDGTNIVPTLNTSVVPNPYITWERNNNYNIGMDFGLLNDALTFTAEGWYNRTTDILGTRTASTPLIVGATLPAVNYGIASAQGVEFSANYQKKIGQVSFSVGGNIAYSVNKCILQDVAPGTRAYDNPIGHPMNRVRVRQLLINGTGNGVVRTQMEASTLAAENAVGATPYTTGSEKVQLEPGMLYLRDFRGSNGTLFANSPDGNSNHLGSDDMVFIPKEYTTPPMVYGLNGNIHWKGLELNMLAAGTGGYWASQVRGLTSLFENTSGLWPNPWLPSNIDANHANPIYAIHANWAGGRLDYPNTYTTRNMSFLRMKNMSLGYTIPAKITSTIGIQSLKFYISAENPFIIFKKCPSYMDPESIDAAGYPILRVYSFGAKLTL